MGRSFPESPKDTGKESAADHVSVPNLQNFGEGWPPINDEPHPPSRSLRRRVNVGLAIAFLLLAVMGYLAKESADEFDRESELVTHTNEVIISLEGVARQALDAQLGARGFALSGKPEFIQTLLSGKAQISALLEQSRQLVKDNKAQTDRMAQLQEHVTNLMAASSKMISIRESTNAPPEGDVLFENKRFADLVRRTVRDMEAEEQRLLAERNRRASEARDSTRMLSIVGTAAGFLLLILASVLIHRQIGVSENAWSLAFSLNQKLEERVQKRTKALQAEIRARQHAELALAESEHRLSGIVESASDAIVAVDGVWRVVLFNPAAEHMFDCSRVEAIGRTLDNFIPEADASSNGGWEADATFGRKSRGERFPIEASMARTEVDGQKLVTVIIRDITERKRAEDALRMVNETLETKVLERTKELQEAKERAESADRMKSAFLATMSHELRTPLNAVIGFTGTLLMRLPGPLNDDQEHQLRTVQNSARHLLSLINDILDLAKIESGKMEPHFEPVKVVTAVGEIVATLRPSAQRKGIELGSTLPSEEFQMKTDRRAFQQIVINLINNAIKFTDEGGVRVDVKQEEQDSDTTLEIVVSDTGIGISDEDQQRLFQPFGQVRISGRRNEGTGLGLHLSRKLAEILGGTISLESAIGRGSRFTLRLPTN